MANPFDQFDAPAPAAGGSGNPFDQFDAPAKPEPSWTDQALDFLKSIPRGVLSGLADTAAASGQAAAIEMGQPEMQASMPTGEQGLQSIEQNVTGPMHPPETTAGKYGATVGTFLGNPASYVGPGGLLGKAVTTAGAGLGSEALGQLTEGSGAEPYARIVGAVLGAKAPSAGMRVITPLPISAERQAAVDALRAEGVQPTAGQITGSKALKYAESALGDAPFAGGKATAAQEAQAEQFTRAALRRVGEDADRATPEVIDRAFTRIGNQFDDLAARNAAQHDAQYVNDIIEARNEYDTLFLDPLHSAKVEKVFDRAINNVIRSGQMEGDVYKAQRSQIERMRRASRDPELSMYLADVRDAMDGVMERSIAATNPSDLGAWREVRSQYRNLLALERVSGGGGEQAAAGLISPARLRQAVVAQGRRSYARGIGDFADLARSGNEIMTPLPQSGTGPRLLTHGMPAAIGAALGSPGGLHGAGLGAALGAYAGPAISGRVLMSRPVQAYLRNQAMANALRRMPTTSARALVGAVANPFTHPLGP